MSTHDELLESVRLNPDSDEPRLVYADWLEENGDPDRAQFIQVQCALNSDSLSPKERQQLEEVEQSLLASNVWDWAEHLGTDVTEWTFHRGFIERVETCLEYNRDEIVATLTQPMVRHVRDVTQFCEFDSFVEALPQLSHLTGLEFWGLYAFENDLLRKILESPSLANLRTLILQHDRNGNLAEEKVIIDGLMSPLRSNIEELCVNVDGMWQGPSNAILHAIADSPSLRKLKRLNIANAGDTGNDPQLTVESVQRLASSSNLQNLEELDLRSTHATEDVWEAILQMPQLPRLKKLLLNGACQVPEGEWIPIVGQIADLERWRGRFDDVGIDIDWETTFLDPWTGGCWKGFSWAGRKREALFAMADFLPSDLDGLASHFRSLCVELAGEAEALKVERVSFSDWASEIRPALIEAIEMAESTDSNAIVFRIRPDVGWKGELGIHHDYQPDSVSLIPTDPDRPFEEYSYNSPNEIVDGPRHEPAARLLQKHRLGKGTRPSGPGLYLIARCLAEFVQLTNSLEANTRIFISFMWAVFRVK